MATERSGFLPRQGLDDLFELLRQSGYVLVGPRAVDGAIVYGEIRCPADLPRGVSLDAQPGAVRTCTLDSARQFDWANGPQALKPLLFKPVEPLWQVCRDAAGHLQFSVHDDPPPRIAVLGVRACDLAALRLQDQHFIDGEFSDTHYARRRERLLLIAVNCTRAAATCFCVSTRDGPEVTAGHDLLLDELDDGFLVSAGSAAGTALVAGLDLVTADDAQLEAARRGSQRARSTQTRSLPAGDLYELLSARREHPRWAEVARRCLACGNCTQVCPTCSCSRERDETGLPGETSSHVREWDSCFTEGHSYIHGLVVRADIRQRYRQWLTHKLGSWHHQYGRSGCVGCGRCIAWCPVGIDICEEIAALMQEPPA